MLTPEEIVAKLAEFEPTAPSETDGTPYCFFCSAYIPKTVADHDADCIWREAVGLVGRTLRPGALLPLIELETGLRVAPHQARQFLAHGVSKLSPSQKMAGESDEAFLSRMHELYRQARKP